MAYIGTVLGWKFNHAPGIKTIDGVITEWPALLGDVPTQAEIDTYTGEYETYFAGVAAAQAAADLKVANAKTGMQNLPGWATWTAQQVEDWIVANIGDLSTAAHRAALITAIKAIGKAIIYLRDHGRITE